jgi:hypothetical protein
MSATGTIHAAKLGNSPRLQRVLAVLLDGQPHTTRDLIREAEVCAVNSIADELRANGIGIDCTAAPGERGVYEYRLAAGQLALAADMLRTARHEATVEANGQSRFWGEEVKA